MFLLKRKNAAFYYAPETLAKAENKFDALLPGQAERLTRTILAGLPGVVSTEADHRQLFDAVPERANDMCFCTGSLGVRPDNNLVGIIRRLGSRNNFLHLRNANPLASSSRPTT